MINDLNLNVDGIKYFAFKPNNVQGSLWQKNPYLVISQPNIQRTHIIFEEAQS